MKSLAVYVNMNKLQQVRDNPWKGNSYRFLTILSRLTFTTIHKAMPKKGWETMGKSYAVRVKQFMERHKVSRNLLASMTQVYPNHIAKVESGELLPTEDWWTKFEIIERTYARKDPNY